MKLYSMRDLLALPQTNQIADRLRDAAAALDCGNPESAAWRLADAAQLLRQRIDRCGLTNVEGVHTPTNKGALLGAHGN